MSRFAIKYDRFWINSGDGSQLIQSFQELRLRVVRNLGDLDIEGDEYDEYIPDNTIYTWNGRLYCRDIKKIICQIGGKETGRTILRNLRPETINVMPYEKAELNAEGGGERGSWINGIWVPDNKKRLLWVIKFTPAVWRLPGSSSFGLGKKKQYISYDPDSIFLHELVHVLCAQKNRKIAHRRQQLPWRYDNDSDFYSILIGNIYRSEYGFDDARTSHRSLKTTKQTSKEFVKIRAVRKALKIMKKEMRNIYNQLKQVKANWNPIRDYEARYVKQAER